MTDDEARRLSMRCVDTWPSGPKGYIWRDELVHHPFTIATRALEQLTQTQRTRPPMIGDLVAVIANLQAEAAGRPTPPHCIVCDGTGWVDGAPIVETVNGEPHTYTTVTKCACNGGRPVAQQLEAF